MSLKLWHGGRIEGTAEIRPSRSGRYEYGPGIYLTTSYDTARKYSKGGKVTYIVTLSTPLRWLEKTRGSVGDMIAWVKQQSGLRHKREIISDLETRTTQYSPDNVPLSYLVNLTVNYAALSGQHGQALAMWLVEHGVDAGLDKRSMEDWVIVFNPDIIESKKAVKASEVDWTTNPDFPRVEEQQNTNNTTMAAIKYKGAVYRLADNYQPIIDVLQNLDGSPDQETASVIRRELTKIMDAGETAGLVRKLSGLGLLPRLFPEIEKLKGVAQPVKFHAEGDVFNHTMLVLENAQRGVVPQMAALLHDIGKPDTFTKIEDKISFPKHENVSAEKASEVLRRLGFDDNVIKRVVTLVQQHMRAHTAPKWGPAAVKKFIRDLGYDEDTIDQLLDLTSADALGRIMDETVDRQGDDYVKAIRSVIKEKIKELKVPPTEKTAPILTGNDVMRILGIQPGPEVKYALMWLKEQADELAEKGEVLTPELASSMLKTKYKKAAYREHHGDSIVDSKDLIKTGANTIYDKLLDIYQEFVTLQEYATSIMRDKKLSVDTDYMLIWLNQAGNVIYNYQNKIKQVADVVNSTVSALSKNRNELLNRNARISISTSTPTLYKPTNVGLDRVKLENLARSLKIQDAVMYIQEIVDKLWTLVDAADDANIAVNSMSGWSNIEEVDGLYKTYIALKSRIDEISGEVNMTTSKIMQRGRSKVELMPEREQHNIWPPDHRIAKYVQYRGAFYKLITPVAAFDPDKYRYDEPPSYDPSAEEEEEKKDPDYYEEGVLVKPKHVKQEPSWEF